MPPFDLDLKKAALSLAVAFLQVFWRVEGWRWKTVMWALLFKQKMIHSSIPKKYEVVVSKMVCIIFAAVLLEMIQFDDHIFFSSTTVHETRFL